MSNVSADRSVSVARAASLCLIGLFVALALAMCLLLYRSYIASTDRIGERVTAAAKIVDTNAGWIDALAKQALRRIDEALGDDIKQGTPGSVSDIRDAVNELPGQVTAYVVDSSGATVLSTDPAIRPMNITDREYFSALTKGKTFYTSSLLISRLNGQQIFVFSRRLERHGLFAGAAIVAFEAKMLLPIWESVDLGRNSTVSIIRDDGQLVARYPLAPRPLDMSKYVLFTTYLKQSPVGVYEAISPLDGSRRIVGYRKVFGTDYVVIAAADANEAMRPFWSTAYISAGFAAAIALGVLSGGLWIARLLRRETMQNIALQSALETNNMLLREVHHRVKNNMASMQSLLRLSDIPEMTRLAVLNRIAAMMAVHEQIYQRDQFSGVYADELVPSIVDHVTRAYGSQVSVTCDISHILVGNDQATPLALLINEVVTNALKYAFPEGRSGRITVTMHAKDNERAVLIIQDDGIGFLPEEVKSGMGTRLIKGSVAQLLGTYRFDTGEGTLFSAILTVNSHANRGSS